MINSFALSILFVSTFLAALAGVYFKRSTKTLSLNPKLLLKNRMFVYGGLISAAAAVMYVFALRLEHLSKAYPATSMTYIWTIFLSHFMIGEKINLRKSIGIIFIVTGIFLISYL